MTNHKREHARRTPNLRAQMRSMQILLAGCAGFVGGVASSLALAWWLPLLGAERSVADVWAAIGALPAGFGCSLFVMHHAMRWLKRP